MERAGQGIAEHEGLTPGTLPGDLLTATAPFVLRGFVAHWPLVAAGRRGIGDALDYLRGFDRGATVTAAVGAPELRGRIFYNDDFTGPNFESHRVPLARVFDRLSAHAQDPQPPLLYVASTTLETALPGLDLENAMPLGDRDVLTSVWIGNRARIAPHYDLPDNLACVAVGHRRFTLFPPDQLDNLYVGPIDITPAGQPISLVDLAAPDFDRFPKFRDALAAAVTAELEPGDAIFIPSMWWHHVESLDPLNMLVNYWWRQSPAYMGPPVNVLHHALLAIRDLPPAQKRAWKEIFDHYVFDNRPDSLDHIPEASRGVLGPMDDRNARRIRAFLLNRLNR